MYVRKTRDVYDVEVDYGYGYGYEPVHTTYDLVEARRVKADYKKNDNQAKNVRIHKYREKIEV